MIFSLKCYICKYTNKDAVVTRQAAFTPADTEEAHTGSTDLNEKMHPARDAKQLILSNFINPIEKVHNFVG